MSETSKNILIIDDEEAIVLLLTTIFGLYDYTSHSCTRPLHATKMAAEIKPDLIILDIAMPEKDGYEICQELKTSPQTRDIPIIMLTALALNQDRKRGLEAGADGFIFKPFDPHTVMTEIARLLG
ncbi:MAG: two-component system response regulator [Candidatus Riflebacteria bacterium HGW-Riflebacteria-2]|jgi:CheY-like chemotaxis protein|nr:MAG: two-component system response regulator [Candidatus Riflebacteria bacterium HGW-Riflebacteria-2]